MKKTRIITAIILSFFIVSCKHEKWYRTESGMLYKVYQGKGEDSIAKIGRIIKVNYVQKVGDSIMESTYDAMPYYEMVVPNEKLYNPSAVFAGLRKGDSVVVKQRVDSMIRKKIFTEMPSYIKKDDEWITTIKVIEVFAADSLVKKDKEKEIKRVIALQKGLSRIRLEKMFRERGIQAAEIEEGVYLKPVSTGKGPKPSMGKWVSALITVSTTTGRKLNGETSDKKSPASFILGSHFLPVAIENAILYTRKGDRIKVIAPSVLLFGVQPPSKKIRIDDDLEFDIEILDVRDREPGVVRR